MKLLYHLPLRWKSPFVSRPASDDVLPPLIAVFRAVNSFVGLTVGSLQPAGQMLVVGIGAGVVASAHAAVFWPPMAAHQL